ncbi:hypothetical protein SCUCBS95973_001296 [Sporothrix curviconia]|uniref:HORMA domain-containing protein n=1 Tax=Sporothrix curviconia TaxID=1260050 RepID=A0ABP0AXE8_9PEZI
MASLSLDEATQLYSTLHHFFEVAVHTVLYYRRLYPERAFATATAFDVPVHQCRHPAVCAWVRATIEQVMVQITGGVGAAASDRLPTDGVNAVAVVVHAPYHETPGIGGGGGGVGLPAGAVLERWVFDVRHLPRGWPGGIEALRRAQTDRGKRDEHGDGAERGEHEGESEGKEARQPRRQSPEKAAAGAGDANGDEEGEVSRYHYYDEEEELANAESEAELDDDDEDDNGSEDEPGSIAHATDSSVDRDIDDGSRAINWTDLDDQLRGVLQRLAQAGQQVAALPDGCTFTVAIELGDTEGGVLEATGARRHMHTNWIPETGGFKQRLFGGGAAATRSSTTSVRSVDSAPLYLECWVEESAIKHAAAKGATRAQMEAKAGLENGGILRPPQAAELLTAATASYKDGSTTRRNKGKTVSFS